MPNDSLPVHGQHLAVHAARLIDEPDLLIRGILQRESPLPSQHLYDQIVEILGTGTDDDLIGRNNDPAASGQILRDGLAQKHSAAVGRALQKLFSMLCQNLARRLCKHRERKLLLFRRQNGASDRNVGDLMVAWNVCRKLAFCGGIGSYWK